MADPGVFSGQYGDDASWNYLQNIYATARQQLREQGKQANAAEIAAATGLTADEVGAIEQMAQIREGGYDAPTWTREDLWRRVSNAGGRMQEAEKAKAGQAAAAEEDRIRGDITANINKFLQGLNPGSPEYQQAQVYISKRAQSAQGASSARAGLGSFGSGGAQTGQGLGGGLSAYGEGTIQADMNTKYRLQNEQLKAQGLGLLNQRDLGLKGLELGYQQMQNQQAEQAWAAQQNQNQGIGSAIGAGLGALGFIGGPALGAATMSGGAAVGGALGGLASGGSAPRYASMPSWTQGGGNKGSLGGSGY